MLECLYGVIGKPLFQRILVRTVTSLDGFMRSFWELEQRQFFSFSRLPPKFCGLGQWSLWFGGKLMMPYRCVYIDGKASACNAGDPGSIPWLGSSPGEGNGNALQYSSLEKSHGQRSLVGHSPWGYRVGHDWTLVSRLKWKDNRALSVYEINIKSQII